MRLAYLVSVWLHILAATAWLGGMIFLIVVVVPTLRSGERATAAAIMRESGRRFRTLGWSCFVLLAITGSFNLWWRGVRFDNLFASEFVASQFGTVLWTKLATFALVLLLSGLHDFLLGPRASAAAVRSPQSAEAERLRRGARLMGRLTAILALLLFALGVLLVRGA